MTAPYRRIVIMQRTPMLAGWLVSSLDRNVDARTVDHAITLGQALNCSILGVALILAPRR